MRKVVKPGKVCEHCGSRLTSPIEARFCDYCKEKIDDETHIRATVFWERSDDAKHDEFCSFQCFFDWMRSFPYNKKMVNFVSLPYVGGSNKIFEDEYEVFIHGSTPTTEEEEK